MTTRKSMLLSNKCVYALAMSAMLITSCSKKDAIQELPTESEAVTGSIISAAATPGLKAFSFTEIPFGSADLINPGRGAEQWHDRTDVNVPSEAVKSTALDVYYRFVWTRIEGTTLGSYNWSYFDKLVNAAIAKKQKFSFGIMTVYPEGTTNEGLQAYDGGTSAYPQYLHNLMKAEAVKDWRSGSTWVPFLLCFWLLLFSPLFVRPPQMAILLFCISFSWGWS